MIFLTCEQQVGENGATPIIDDDAQLRPMLYVCASVSPYHSYNLDFAAFRASLIFYFTLQAPALWFAHASLAAVAPPMSPTYYPRIGHLAPPAAHSRL
jgi:hypothetical protein